MWATYLVDCPHGPYFLVGLDNDFGNFALQASGALSPNATSDFRLPSKIRDLWVAMQVFSRPN